LLLGEFDAGHARREVRAAAAQEIVGVSTLKIEADADRRNPERIRILCEAYTLAYCDAPPHFG